MNVHNTPPGEGYLRLLQIIGQKEVTKENAAENPKANGNPFGKLDRRRVIPFFDSLLPSCAAYGRPVDAICDLINRR